MHHVPYFSLNGLEDVYLEDSYVLAVKQSDDAIQFKLDLVLRESHPQYKTPEKNEQYCYRKAKLVFNNMRKIDWLKSQSQEYFDANGDVDYGNIDEFYAEGNQYYLSGDWGKIRIVSDQPELIINGQ